MDSEKDEKKEGEDRLSISDRKTQEIKLPGAPEKRSLDEMNEEMFQSPAVKRLFAFTKAIGKIGHSQNKPLQDYDNAKGLVDLMKDCSLSYTRFDEVGEVLFNGILNGEFKEEDVDFTYKDFSNSLVFWLHFSIDMFGQSTGPEYREQERAIHELLGNDVIVGEQGENIDGIIDHLIKSAHSQESRQFLLRATHGIHDAKSRRALGQAQLEARRDFKKVQDAIQGPAQTAEPQAAPEQTSAAPQPPEAPQQPQAPERTEILNASLIITYWHKDKPYEDRQQIKVPQENGTDINPFVRPKKSIQLVDRGEPSDITATIEVDGDKIVLIRQGKEDVIDVGSGLPVPKLEIKEGEPVCVQIGDEFYQIAIDEISTQKRTTITPYNPSPGEAQRGGSKPDIEVRESLLYTLRAVLVTDRTGKDILNAYPCPDEGEIIINIGTDSWNDIVVPLNPNTETKAHVVFYPGVIFVRSGPATTLSLRNTPGGFIPGATTVQFEEDDVLKVGENGNAVYLKVSRQHPFNELDIKQNLDQRFQKIGEFIDANEENITEIREAGKTLKKLTETVLVYEKVFDITNFMAISVELSEKILKLKGNLEERKSLEVEAKKVLKQHFDADAGETAETPRPFKYAVLVEKMNTDQQTAHIIFPPALTTGKNPINTLELHQSRESKYPIQDNECTFVLDGTTGVRMVMERRTDKKSKILVNGQIPGTRDGKTEELDMLRPPLKDGDVIEIGNKRFILETNHEFTVRAVKPYAVRYMKEIMEVLVLMPENSDEGERKNAIGTLTHFLEAGIITPAEQKSQQALFESEKATREITQVACQLLDEIREQNQELINYIETDQADVVGLPYDSVKIRAAIEYLDGNDVRWDDTGWTPEQYGTALAESARARLYAYDKKLLQKRTEFQESKLGTRLLSVFSKETELKYKEDQAVLQRTLRQILVEMISIIELDVAGPEYVHGWLGTRLDAQQAEQAEEITLVHKVMHKIHEGETFTAEEITKILALTQNMTYADFFNAKEVERDTPMDKFIFAKIKARSRSMIEEAREGNSISENLNQLQALIACGFLSYEKIESSPEEFADLRYNEESLTEQKTKLKAGHEALEQIMSSAEPDLEAIVDFAKRLSNDEIALSDEKDEDFKIYCRQALEAAVKNARVGHMTAYTAILATSAVRLKIAKPKEFGTTAEELQQLHDLTEATKENEEMDALIEEVRGSSLHNLHPLIKLARHLDQQPDSFRHEGQTVENILNKLVNQRMEMMVSQVMQGEDPGFMEMILEDMRQYGFEPMIKHCMSQSLSDAIDSLYQEIETVDTVRPFIETLRLLNLGEIVRDVRDTVVGDCVEKYLEEAAPDAQAKIEKLGQDLESLGL